MNFIPVVVRGVLIALAGPKAEYISPPRPGWKELLRVKPES